MNGIFEAAHEIQRFLEDRQWRFSIIGGLAVLRWGEPFATQDVDVSLLCGFGNEAEYVDELLVHFAARVDGARQFALDSRVVLLRASNGVCIDIVLTGIPFEEQVILRCSPFAFSPELLLTTCSAEDLVVLKAFAGRPKDWAALEGVVRRQAASLDWSYVEENLAPLCELKGEPDTVGRLMQLRERLG